ncbi:MAG: ATP synthase F1 subunit gamma [Patescibacteria group bacterium]
MALKQIKNKIISTKKTGKVTKAMEAVSAVKMRKSQMRAFESRPYVRTAMRILSRLADSHEGLAHPLAQKRERGRRLLIIVTSDKGLAGSVNSAVLKRVDHTVLAHPETDVVCIGRKASEYAQRQNLKVLYEHTNVSDDISLAEVSEISTLAVNHFTQGTYTGVDVVYQNFLSTFEQEPVKRQVLPLDTAEIMTIMEGIKPRAGAKIPVESQATAQETYTVEPSAEAVLNILIPQLVQVVVYHALLESKASEHSARMVAMKNATDKSKEVTRFLTLKYNKARQAAITAEVAEITGGMEAMK